VRIVRQRSPDRFTALDNELIEDRAISYRALGVITYLLSRPDGWETDSDTLAHSLDDSSDLREGRDAIRTALRQLERAGYLRRERVQDRTTGRWSMATTVIDTAPGPRNPSPAPGPRKPDVGFLGDKNQSTEPKHSLGVAVGDQPPPVVTSRGSRSARPEEEAPNVSLAALGELCAEMRVIRRDEGLPLARWSDHNIRRAVRTALERGYPPEAVPDALRELARDPATQSPGRLPHDGDWWTAVEADMLRRRRLDAAARARKAALEADARRARDCRRCAGTGEFRNFCDKPVRCDHIPDVDDEVTA
jgi:hypothetical protein